MKVYIIMLYNENEESYPIEVYQNELKAEEECRKLNEKLSSDSSICYKVEEWEAKP